jgi:hypothetical protein
MGIANQGVTPGRTTLVEAVNVLLSNIGEAPVATLEDDQNAEAAVAERTILEFHKEGQTRGWSWNQEQGYKFVRDVSTNEIVVPTNVVRFAPDAFQWAHRFVLRGQRVYDKQERTYALVDIPYLEADVTFLLSWDECPEAYNRWVVIRSARVFSDRILSSDSISKYTAEQEQRAWMELMRVENDQVEANVLSGGLEPFPTFLPASGLGGRRTSGMLRRG